LIHFDSLLLVKAQRVLQMHTYDEVRRMASAMLTNFDSLCEVLVNLNDDQVHPELCKNQELRETAVNLEAIWAECQFVLQQGVLDFMQQLLEYLPQVSATCRWQLRLVMEGGLPPKPEVEVEPEIERRNFRRSSFSMTQKLKLESSGSLSASQKLKPDHSGTKNPGEAASDSEMEKETCKKEIEDARKTFFETLPILVYLDEMRRDIKLSEEGDTSATSHFRDLFCPKNDRHHMLRRDFAKFDERRYHSFINFLLGVHEEGETDGAGLHATYFQNVYKQLREVVAFPVDKSPMEALQVATCFDANEMAETHVSEERQKNQVAVKMAAEACARWVCVQRVAQTVQPDLFPKSKPEMPKPARPADLDSLSDADSEPRVLIVTPRTPRKSPRERRTSARKVSQEFSSGRRTSIVKKMVSSNLHEARRDSKLKGDKSRTPSHASRTPSHRSPSHRRPDSKDKGRASKVTITVPGEAMEGGPATC